VIHRFSRAIDTLRIAARISVKRRAVLKRVKAAAQAQGLEFRETELTNHTGIVVGNTRSTLGRHSEIAEGTAYAFFRQFESELGKGWWR
jgi:hypothetical protein